MTGVCGRCARPFIATCRAAMRLARWLYDRIKAEYEHLPSDETVDHVIAANGYTFTAEGRRFG